jgi:phospholipid transport system substrate-binding protein
MRATKYILVRFAAVMIILNLTAASAGAGHLTDVVKSTVDTVLETLKDSELSRPDQKIERRKKISSAIRDMFDFDEMARRSLARHWKKRTAGEKKEFSSIFSDLLEASYIEKIEAYTDDKVTFDKEVIKGKGKYGVVGTTIITKDVDIPIDYKVKLKEGRWRVYDVVIEGVSFISTYRSQYNQIIVKESYASLIKKMKTKLGDINL